jgi:phosphate transport system substrate-binding protein
MDSISTGLRRYTLALIATITLIPVAQAQSTGDFRLDSLPRYEAGQRVSGTIRNFGADFGGLLVSWEEGFRKIHPEIRFEDHLPSSDTAIPALVAGVAELGPDGGEPSLTEALAFFETYDYHPTSITVATGTFDVPRRSGGMVVFVNADNPLSKLTVQQLDGIFGAQRTGGMRGFKWTPSDGRGAQEDIRTWGQLGLTGEWADKPIQTYGAGPSGMTRFFQLKVLKNGDKWNPNYREYVETGTKIISDEDRVHQLSGLRHMFEEDLAHDRYGIAWATMAHVKGISGIKPIALAARDGGPYVAPTKASFQDRSYPLVRNIYLYLNRPPGKALDPKLKEFLRYVLSREGQEIVVSNGNYLPLTAEIVREQLAKLQ